LLRPSKKQLISIASFVTELIYVHMNWVNDYDENLEISLQ